MTFTMKHLRITLLALLVQTSLQSKEYTKNVPTFEIGDSIQIENHQIEYSEPDCEPGLQCKTAKSCADSSTVPSVSEDKKHFACCLDGQHLLGSPDTAFDCCADGHDLVGSSETGYHCCPTGQTYDGKVCKEASSKASHNPSEQNACPDGTEQAANGTCQALACDSGLQSGKCYAFTGENGNKLGVKDDGFYYAAPDSLLQRFGKFQLCKDANCTAELPINPSDLVYIKDIFGDPKTGANGKQWLNNAKDGAHISRTLNLGDAGRFSLSKWPGDKYCLTGFDSGVGPACPSETPAMTFFSQDSQMCVPYTLTEVPCDIKSNQNNCIWK